MIFRGEAFAKTNLVLKVLGRREDGFHELETIFQTIDLTDEIEVSDGPSGIELECTDPAVPSDARNLAHRAAVLLREHSEVSAGARIRLVKRIPAGGGLGGGSSDAATVLVLLCRLWSLRPALASLVEIGSALGSDVPFFFAGGTARGRGRGEIVEPMADVSSQNLILAVPPFSISTAEVFAHWRPMPTSRGGAVFGANELASAVLETYPEMVRFLEVMSRYYPDCQISGSGASLIAAEDDPDPERLSALRAELPDARILRTRTVSRSEYQRRSTVESAFFQRR